MFLRPVLAILLLVVVATAQKKRYNGDKVFRLIPETVDQLKVIRQFLEAPSDQFDFWTQPSSIGQPVDIRIAAPSLELFSGLMNATKILNRVMINDVQQMIDDVEFGDRAKMVRGNRASIVGTFQPHAAINDWLMSLCAEHPTMATCGDIGFSYEKRIIKYIKLGTQPMNGTVKQKVWIEGNMHAREWLSGATVIYVINRLLNNYTTDPVAKRMLDSYDWYIIPISNPDGYEFSRNKERLWRKTRSKSSALCYGADPNRNWGYHWGGSGSATSPCSDQYQGPKAFSEIETKSISDFVMANRNDSRIYFSIHTYAQYWLIPYGFKGTDAPKSKDFDELLRVGKIGTAALEAVNKKTWKCGNVIDLLYEAAGISIDWAKGEAGIKYSYCLELRPSRGTLNGFVVSEKEIDPSGREVWAGLTAAIDAIPN